jgi:hypothetical protein
MLATNILTFVCLLDDHCKQAVLSEYCKIALAQDKLKGVPFFSLCLKFARKESRWFRVVICCDIDSEIHNLWLDNLKQCTAF